MAGAYVSVGYNEKLPIYSGAWTPDTGTETIVSVTVTLRDASGNVAGSVSGTAATGFIAVASAGPNAWYEFYPGPAGLNLTEPTFATGQAIYSLEFVAVDSNGHRYVSTIIIVLNPKGA